MLELYRGTNFERGESDTLGNIGGVYLLLGQYREAMRYYRQSLAISERLNLKPSASQDLGNLALCHLALGQLEQALSSFDRALLLAHEAGLKKEEADWRKAKGSALVRLGRYAPAREEFQQALQTYEQAGLKRELIEALNDRGNLYVVLGDAASAEKDYRRAIQLAREINHPRGVTFNLIALANLEFLRKRYEEAGALYRDALARAREAGEKSHMASSLTQLALTYRAQQKTDEALQEAQRALGVAQEIKAPGLEAEARYALGEANRTAKQFAAALDHYIAGEKVLERGADPELGWRLAYGQGQALEALERDQEAVHAYQHAVQIIEAVRSQLREERFRAGYIEDKYQVYVALVRLLLKLGRTDEAFRFAEKLRARSYLELLGRSQPPIRSEAQRQAEAALRERIRQLQRAIEQETSKPPKDQRRKALEVYSDELLEAERAYQSLLDDLLRTDPEYAAVRALKVPSSDEVQRQLPADTALVEYVVAEDSVAIFVITAEKISAQTVPLRAADLDRKSVV